MADERINLDLNQLSYMDRSEYLRGFAVLIRKNGCEDNNEKMMFSVIGKFLGFETEFCNDCLDRLLENQYLSEKPAVFTNKLFAEFFISDIKRLINLTVFEINLVSEWLRQTAEINNVDISI